MNCHKTTIDGLLVLESLKFPDLRGSFYESYSHRAYESIGIRDDFVQDNISYSTKGVLRGLHCQKVKSQSQLVTVISGSIFDVCLDLRKESSTFGQWYSILLEEEGKNQIYMPPGFAHGFCVLSNQSVLHYKVSELYDPKNDSGILWNDSSLNIPWPIKTPIISEKDKENISFEEYIKSSA